MAYNIQFKRATAARIAEVPNTVLFAGEPLLDTTNNQLYIGDGTTKLSSLKPIQNTQGVLDDMVTKGLLTSSTTTTVIGTEDYTTDILQLDSSNSPQGTITSIDTTTATISISEDAYNADILKVNFEYPVTTGVLGSGDLDSMINVATANSYWGNISIVWLNNGVETTFYKDINDMTQTLTREGPFQYQVNSDNNMFIFIDPQTTLKSFSVINNNWCNPNVLVRMTNATYESTESVTTYALNLPTATSSTLGLVKPDNSTIIVDANGVVTANIPAPVTVDQIYDATSTNAQSGVAIAGAGFMNSSIVQSPLQYTPANVPDYIGDITPSSPSVNWYRTYKVSDSNPIMLYTNNSASSSSYISTAESLMSYVFNNAIKVEIQNPKNIAFTYAYELQTQGQYSGASGSVVVGYEENNTFVPVYATTNTSTYGGSVEFFTINAFNSNYGGEQCGFYYSGLNYPNVAIQIDGNTVKITRFNGTSGENITCSISNDTLAEINKCNIAYFSLQGRSATTYENITNYKLCNPTNAMYNMTYAEKYAAFSSTDDLLYTQIEALSLKYDNTTLGVNASNELTIPVATTSNLGLVQPDGTTVTINNGVISAASSTPSNMVTTDTSQNISGTKTFRVTTTNYTPTLELKGYNSTGNNGDFISICSNDYTSPSGVNIGYAFNLPVVKIYGSTSGANSTFITYSGLYRNGSSTFTFWENYAKNSKLTLKNYQDIIMDSSMLDGTYLIWDSTNNKITVDIQAIKDAIDALGT